MTLVADLAAGDLSVVLQGELPMADAPLLPLQLLPEARDRYVAHHTHTRALWYKHRHTFLAEGGENVLGMLAKLMRHILDEWFQIGYMGNAKA